MIIWEKIGKIFECSGRFSWSRTHTQVPVVDKLEDYWRVYYSTRNELGKSCISYIDVEKSNPQNVLYVHDRPVLTQGKPGTFDDSGVMPTSIIQKGNKKLLYFIGWNSVKTVPYSNAVGACEIGIDGYLERISEGPVIGRCFHEPFFCGTCYVTHIGKRFVAYYLSCIGWKKYNNKYEPFYNVKIGHSEDGIDWVLGGKEAISLKENEGGIASATVIEYKGNFHMWFSVRGHKDYRKTGDAAYRLGYAVSKNGYEWQRDEGAKLPLKSADGWDSEMIGYPYVVKHQNELFMFYNGNGFGQSGFGYAKAKIYRI